MAKINEQVFMGILKKDERHFENIKKKSQRVKTSAECVAILNYIEDTTDELEGETVNEQVLREMFQRDILFFNNLMMENPNLLMIDKCNAVLKYIDDTRKKLRI